MMKPGDLALINTGHKRVVAPIYWWSGKQNTTLKHIGWLEHDSLVLVLSSNVQCATIMVVTCSQAVIGMVDVGNIAEL